MAEEEPLKLTRKTALWVGGVTPLAALMILLSFLLFGKSGDIAERQKNSAVVLSGAETLLSNLQGAETGQRGYLLTGDESYLEPYQAVRHKIAGQLAQLRQLTQDDALQQHRLSVLTPLVDARLAKMQQTIALRRANYTEDVLKEVRSGQGKKLMDSIRAEMNDFISMEHDLFAQQESEFDATRRHLLMLIIASSALIGVLSLVSAYVVYSETRRRIEIQEASNKTITNAQDILRDKENTLLTTHKELDNLQVILNDQKNDLLLEQKALDARQKALHEAEEPLLVARKELEVRERILNDRDNVQQAARMDMDALETTLSDQRKSQLVKQRELDALQEALHEEKQSLIDVRATLEAQQTVLNNQDNSLLGVRKELDELQMDLGDQKNNQLVVQKELAARQEALHKGEETQLVARKELDELQMTLSEQKRIQLVTQKEQEARQGALDLGTKSMLIARKARQEILNSQENELLVARKVLDTLQVGLSDEKEDPLVKSMGLDTQQKSLHSAERKVDKYQPFSSKSYSNTVPVSEGDYEKAQNAALNSTASLQIAPNSDTKIPANQSNSSELARIKKMDSLKKSAHLSGGAGSSLTTRSLQNIFAAFDNVDSKKDISDKMIKTSTLSNIFERLENI
jgi:CHASE3 domain sensor protein